MTYSLKLLFHSIFFLLPLTLPAFFLAFLENHYLTAPTNLNCVKVVSHTGTPSAGTPKEYAKKEDDKRSTPNRTTRLINL